MFNLLKIENFKLRRFIPFYVSLAFFVALEIYGMIDGGLSQMYFNYFHNMHDGFAEGVQDCSLSFLYGMLIAWFVGIDFSQRTVHIALVTGNKRLNVVISKLIASTIITTVFHICLIISDLIIFGRAYGFSLEGFCSRDLLWFGVILLQFIAYNSFFVLVTFVCGNVYSATIISVIVASVGGNILRNFLGGNFIYEHSFFCFAKSSQNSDLIPCALCAIMFIVIFVTATVAVFKKKDVN